MFFIVGVGRSGTSLLQSMLNAHPDIASPPETHFLRNYVFPSLKSNGFVATAKLSAFLQADDSFKRIGIPVEQIYDVKAQKVELRSAYLEMLDIYKERKEKKYIVDKDPRNIDFLPQLNHLFPDAKIIHIYRDPRDVIASKMKAAWSKSKPYWLHGFIGQSQIKGGRQLAKKHFTSENYLEIAYEDLIQKPEATLQKLTTFLGVSYDEKMLTFSKSAKELVDKKEIQWKKETMQPLMKGNSNKWKSSLTNFQATFIEQISKEYFQQLNYQKEASKNVNIITRTFLSLLSVLNPIVLLLYRTILLRR